MTKLANSQWPEAVHPAHAGPPPDPDNGTGHPEQRQHEHVAGIPDSGIHHPSTGEKSLCIHYRGTGAGSNGDCAVHPEHPGGASRGCSLYLHQPGGGRDISKPSKPKEV